jgi:hypothetical protein
VRSLLLPARRAPARAVEATPEQVIVTGAAGGAWGTDAGDPGERGWQPAGTAYGRREVPWWTQEKARIYSTAAYRVNPMARAIVDTYTSFAVGDSGVKAAATNPDVQAVVDEFWNDPMNDVGGNQEIDLRSAMLMGEEVDRFAVGPMTGVVRYTPIDPTFITGISTIAGSPKWLDKISFAGGAVEDDPDALTVIQLDDLSGLRTGNAMLFRPWRALNTDIRSMPFLTPILDSLDNYDGVLSNLYDRTALSRYVVWDVEVKGGQPEVDAFWESRANTRMPKSGSIEVHNENVTWKPQTASTGAVEDTQAAQSFLTQVAGGSGLAKHWLAEPEQTNRATGQTMAEPVRRRVQGLQKTWLAFQAERCRFVVDRAVAAGRLPAMVSAANPKTGEIMKIKASAAVTVTGPEVAASDASITASTLMNLSTALKQLVEAQVMTPEAAQVAAIKGWEDYVGIPFRAELARPDANPDDVAAHVEQAQRPALAVVGGSPAVPGAARPTGQPSP